MADLAKCAHFQDLGRQKAPALTTMSSISPAERPHWTAGAASPPSLGGNRCSRLGETERRTPTFSITSANSLRGTVDQNRRGCLRPYNRPHEARTHPLVAAADLPALIGIALSFRPLMIMVISTGRRAMPGPKVSPRIYERIMHMLPIAEAHLRSALCRQAWRALGWNVREVKLEILPRSRTGPTSPDASRSIAPR